jgi:hypothetical protein
LNTQFRRARARLHARLTVGAILTATACLGLATPASAVLWRVSKHHYVSYAGIVGKAHPSNVTRPAAPSSRTKFDAINGNLDYSGGPVMPSSDNYIVVWRPANWPQDFDNGGPNEFCGVPNGSGQFTQLCLGYTAGMTQFFQDLTAASGSPTNSDSVSTQYNDTAGHFAGATSPGHPSAAYGGVLTDTDPYPASGCPGAPSGGRCLTDAQIQAELQKFLSQQQPALPTKSLTHEYFLLTPPGVASCLGRDAKGVWECAGNAVASPSVQRAFCAYHSMTATAGRYIYSNIPDLSLVLGCDPYSSPSPSGNSPDDCSFDTCLWNQSTAEGVLSAVSHEHNESLTDPEPNNAWTDWGSQTGGEIGDKCTNDGLDDPNLVPDRSGGTDGYFVVTPYNEIINGRYYLIQREWSNDSQQCLSRWSLALGESFPVPSFVVSHRNGTTVTFSAATSCTGNAACPSGSEYVWQFNDDIKTGDTPQEPTIESTSPTITHRFPAARAYDVALTVMEPTGLSKGTAQVIRVTAAPCHVPNVKGKSLSAATTAIKAAGCIVGTVRKPARKTGTKLVVGTESPAAGSVVAHGTAVKLTMVWK